MSDEPEAADSLRALEEEIRLWDGYTACDLNVLRLARDEIARLREALTAAAVERPEPHPEPLA